jgi:hypothetical protein
VEPAQIPIQGILSARALSLIEPSAHQSTQMTSPVSCSVGRRADCAYVILANFNGELTVPKVTVHGVAEDISEDLVDKINAKTGPDTDRPTKPPRKRKNELL